MLSLTLLTLDKGCAVHASRISTNLRSSSRIFIKCPVGQLELIAQAIHTAVEIVKRVLHGNADSIDNSALTV